MGESTAPDVAGRDVSPVERLTAAKQAERNRLGCQADPLVHVDLETADEVEALLTRPTLTFAAVSEVSCSRRDRWHPPDSVPWTGADWSNAMCGEAGEAANVVKKLRRIETGVGGANDPPAPELVRKLGAELADTFLYLVLLADFYHVDLPNAIVATFNAVSEREGFPERLPT